jgi:hypothetical protein
MTTNSNNMCSGLFLDRLPSKHETNYVDISDIYA